MSKKKTTEEFIEQARQIHGDTYDYSKVVYKGNKIKVCIICPIHGEFWQMPDKHLIGQGCPNCSTTKKRTREDFIKAATEIHGDKYDYSKVEYTNNSTKVCIICKEHGEFWQTPHNHLNRQGCPTCGLKKQSVPIAYESFLQRAKKIHGDRYIYPSKDEYTNIQVKIPITCKKHGMFYQRPYSHLAKCGCPKCAIEENSGKKRMSLDEFILRARQVHGDKYDYSKVIYVNSNTKITIICPQHGEFEQTPFHHLSGNGCPKCVHPTSKEENEIYEFISKKIGTENIIQGDRQILNGKKLDIYIPLFNFAIEYNGLYWHNTNVVDMNYHIEKLKMCKERGIKLLQIFEDEYIEHKEIVYNKIAHIIGLQQELPRIMGRKCEIHKIDKETAKTFLDTYHIQSFSPSTIYIGAFFEKKLIAVMSFKQENKGSDKWELTRFASNYNYICQGVGGKLFKFFVKSYNPHYIKSFADRRWTVDENNNLYKQLGFDFEKYTPIDYRYYKPEEGKNRMHKFNFRKQILHKKYNLPLTMTEREMTTNLGYKRIYDCGLIKYVWKKERE